MFKLTSLLTVIVLFLPACSPDIGSKEWCEDLKEKPKGEWTVDELKNYTKHCLF